MTSISNFAYFLVGILLGCLLAIFLAKDSFAETLTTPNIIENSELATCDGWSGDTSGSGAGKCQSGNYRTGYQGGEITSDKLYFQDHLTIDDWQTGFDLDYGVRVWSHSSNLYVPLCSATNYDCKDSFTVELKLGDGATVVETFTHNELQSHSGWRDYSYSQTIGENSFENLWATLSLYGIDAGYTSGMYGPQFDDPFINIAYTEYVPPLPEEMDFLVDELENMITEEIFNDEFFDDLVATVNTVGASTMNFNVAISDEMGEEVASMEVAMEMDMEMETISVATTDSEGEEEIVEIDVAEEIQQIAEMEEEPEPEAEAESEEEDAQEDAQKEEAPKESIKTKMVNAIVNQVIAQVETAGGDVEGTRLAMMNMMGGGMKFKSYQRASIPDSVLYNSPTPYVSDVIDPLGSVYALGSDIMMNSMIDSQYNFKN